MSIAKSLKYHTDGNGNGYLHRTHRSKRGKRHKGFEYDASVERKRKLEALKLKDLE